jgi:hypothetical protein
VYPWQVAPLPAHYPERWPAELRLELCTGEMRSYLVLSTPGDPELPLMEEQLREKFSRIVGCGAQEYGSLPNLRSDRISRAERAQEPTCCDQRRCIVGLIRPTLSAQCQNSTAMPFQGLSRWLEPKVIPGQNCCSLRISCAQPVQIALRTRREEQPESTGSQP